jgi:homoserine O-acetyltransferase/O-succinyltransferase
MYRFSPSIFHTQPEIPREGLNIMVDHSRKRHIRATVVQQLPAESSNARQMLQLTDTIVLTSTGGFLQWLMRIRGLLLAILAALMAIPLTAFAQTPWGQGDNPAATQADAWFDNYQFRDGENLGRLRIHYATLGTPHRGTDGEVDNAVLLLHWTGSDGRALLTPTYMKALFDAGRPLDAQRYYLIFPDSVGHGRSSKPSDGLRNNFPHYGYADMVDLQHRLVTQTLAIHKLHAILGVSMGGMNAWQWAETYPEEVEGVMPVVSLPTGVAGRNLLWRRMAVRYIQEDPAWNDGVYTKPFRGWVQAYQLLRMMIDGVPHLQNVVRDGKDADKFLDAAATQSLSADANDVMYSLRSSTDYDSESGLAGIHAKLFALNFTDDEFNPDSLQILQRLTPRVSGARYLAQPGTADSFGHLTMAHPELWSQHVDRFMNWLENR